MLQRGILPGEALGRNGGRKDVHMVSQFPDGPVTRKLLPHRGQEFWWIDIVGMVANVHLVGRSRNGVLTGGVDTTQMLARGTLLWPERWLL